VFGKAWKIGSIGGIPITVDLSWLLLGVLIVYNQLTTFSQVLGPGAAFAVALLSAVLFLGSILGHELAHAFVARLRRLPVTGIRLFMFGGATGVQMERTPGDEFLITVVGPLTSVGIGLALLAVSAVGGLSHAVHDTLRYVGGLNVILGLANLLPGFPLDGGRILHAVLWRVLKSEARATRIAALTGMVAWGGAIAFGAYEIAARNDLGFGLWIVLVGTMMFQGAKATLDRQKVFTVLSRGTVAEAMGPPPETVPAGISLSEAYDRFFRGHEDETFPVVDELGRLAGVATFESASRIGRENPLRPVREAMLPADDILVVRVDDPLDGVVGRLGASKLPAVVMQNGSVVGQIALPDVDRWLRGRTVR
jgi:Zn-dependent protease